MMTRAIFVITFVSALMNSTPGYAQRSSSPASRPGVRGVFEAGTVRLSAAETFEAVSGHSSTTTFGGGVQITDIWRGMFVQADVSRATVSGERLFVHGGQRFPLGIPVDITMMPIEVTVG
jgi:hypothetical protein